MKEFKRDAYRPEQISVATLMLRGLEKEHAENMHRSLLESELYVNDKYQVVLRRPDVSLIHLSIKRLDKDPIHDWRELQEIKNKIVGEDYEAVELYPKESRKADSANQYHLWVLADGSEFPFGFHQRFVVTPEEAELAGAKQRAFESE